MITLSTDSQGILLLASNLALPDKNTDLRPFSFSEWNSFAEKLANSKLERPSAFFKSTPKEWEEALELNNAQVERMQRLLDRGAALSIELERLGSLGIWITTRAEETYPKRLKKVLKRKSPLYLFGAGNPKLASGGVAIVGSRDIDQEGSIFTGDLAKKCVSNSLNVISGGARGVDTIAQDMALTNGGNVVSVLSNGLEQAIRRRETRNYILNDKLLLLSPFHPKATFRAYNAMDRNKYVYGLANYAVVVSAAEKKGGTWAGATENLKYNWVPLFVRTDDAIPQGNLALIKEGAIPITESALLGNESLQNWFNKSIKNNSNTMTFTKNDGVYSSETKEDFDVFGVVQPYLCKALEVGRDLRELAQLLRVEVSQVKLWLERAENEGLVFRTDNECIYKSSINSDKTSLVHDEQISFF